MKHWMMTLCAAATLLASTASAQSPQGITMDVPFPFTAGKTLLDAGEYNVQMQASGTIRVGRVRGPAVFLIVTPAGKTDTDRAAKAVFNRYGDQYFLSQIWNLQETIRIELPPSKEERELKARNVVPSETRVVLARR